MDGFSSKSFLRIFIFFNFKERTLKRVWKPGQRKKQQIKTWENQTEVSKLEIKKKNFFLIDA